MIERFNKVNKNIYVFKELFSYFYITNTSTHYSPDGVLSYRIPQWYMLNFLGLQKWNILCETDHPQITLKHNANQTDHFKIRKEKRKKNLKLKFPILDSFGNIPLRRILVM